MRYRLQIVCGLTAALSAAPALAQDKPANDQIAQGPAPDWATASEPLAVPPNPTGLAFVRSQDTVVHLDAGGGSTFVAQRVVLLQPQALQLGNLAIAWNPASGKPRIHAVRIHRGAETIDVLRDNSFKVLRREDKLEQAVLSGALTAVLKIPDLRVGDELEFAYTMPTGDPTLRGDSADILMLAGATMPGRYRVGVNWDKNAEPKLRVTDDFPAAPVRTDRSLDIRMDNPPTIAPPKDAPPRFAWQRILEYSDFPTWGAVSQRFAGLFADSSMLDAKSPLKAEAARIAAAHPDTLGRAQAALALVQQQVRYVYVGLNGGNYRPAKADETWQRRYGDCKGKTALLLALLGELGIPAQGVLARNEGPDDGFDARLPNPALFDHVLVRARIDGQAYWLDGTLPAVATASLAPDFPYRWVLPLASGGGQTLERIAWSPAQDPVSLNLFEIDARAGFDAPARITATTIKRGPQALGDYIGMAALSDGQLLQAFRNDLGGDSSWTSIDSVKYHFDSAARAGVLEIVGVGTVEWESENENGRSLSLPGGGFSPPSRRQRSAEQTSSAPFYNEPDFNCYVTTVRLPSATKPENWAYNTTFDTTMFGRLYYRAFERKGSSIRMIRTSRIEQTEIDKQQAERDNARLPHFDNSRATISYTPGEIPHIPASQSGVPATYEGDWVHASDACLPPDSRK